METAKLYAAGAFAAGLVITLFLAAYLTPRQWWRRPNARALLIMVVGAWGFGSLILYAVHGRQTENDVAIDSTTDRNAEARTLTAAVAAREAAARAAPASMARASSASASALIAGQSFAVHRDLNLRTAAGVHSARLVTVPAGATVTPTGARNGDWWQIKASVAGHENTGWVNSLWLRRSGE
ncbi:MULTISPECIES: SH3 domain-containing protein [unclassified Duganella]|uniref:SH3 domain-containing protein n=1 Tax=unclassified Duganella TaxID=2636909 RepID=UPI000E345A28|nr:MULTISPECIES: SH3 domain-containing protein [unclassified Duganella]RFP16363.1 SH3 domain-containing protein [Duganella sp. BJB475]RFP32476.1 SH3 domain-containing protein [Duganella sp. BJB476]